MSDERKTRLYPNPIAARHDGELREERLLATILNAFESIDTVEKCHAACKNCERIMGAAQRWQDEHFDENGKPRKKFRNFRQVLELEETYQQEKNVASMLEFIYARRQEILTKMTAVELEDDDGK